MNAKYRAARQFYTLVYAEELVFRCVYYNLFLDVHPKLKDTLRVRLFASEDK